MRKKILMTLAFAFAMSVGAYAQAAETVLGIQRKETIAGAGVG